MALDLRELADEFRDLDNDLPGLDADDYARWESLRLLATEVTHINYEDVDPDDLAAVVDRGTDTAIHFVDWEEFLKDHAAGVASVDRETIDSWPCEFIDWDQAGHALLSNGHFREFTWEGDTYYIEEE